MTDTRTAAQILRATAKKLRDIEREAIFAAMDENDGCLLYAAEQLGISRSTMYRKLAQYKREARESPIAPLRT